MINQLAAASVLPPHVINRRQYFFDERLPSDARNVRHHYCTIEKHGVVLEDDSTDTPRSINGFCGSIVSLDDGTFRLYYTTSGFGTMRIAVAESSDGLEWHPLHLGQETRADHVDGFVFTGVPSDSIEDSGDGTHAADGRVIQPATGRNQQDQVGQPQVFRLPDGRWRMYYWHHQHGWGRIPYLYTIAESEDGLEWHVPDFDRPALNSHWLGDQSALSTEQRLAEKSRRTNDANFVYWNPRLGCFEQFSQWFLDAHPDRRVEEDNCPDFNRMIQRRVSQDGLQWGAPELVIQADHKDPWDQQFYHLAIQYHEDWYIGSLGHYRVEDGQQTMDLELTFSRDGRQWERPMRSGLIPRDPEGRDAEGIYPPNAWIEQGERWLCLYTGTARKHNRHADRSLRAPCIMAASFPKHRFVGLRADAATGGFTTDVFYQQGDVMYLDADIRGWVKAELCDAWGRKIDGYALSQSRTLVGDHGAHTLEWNAVDTKGHRHDPVRVRFEMQDATIFSVYS